MTNYTSVTLSAKENALFRVIGKDEAGKKLPFTGIRTLMEICNLACVNYTQKWFIITYSMEQTPS